MTSQSEDIIPILTSQDLKEMCERASNKQIQAEEDARSLAFKIKDDIEKYVKRTSRDDFGRTYSIKGDHKSVYGLLKKYLPGVKLELHSNICQNSATIAVMGPSWELL